MSGPTCTLLAGGLGGWRWAPRLMLKGLNPRSSSGLDFPFTSKEMFQESLPQLTGLKTFVFTVGGVFDEDMFCYVYQHLPPYLCALRFRWSESHVLTIT